MTAERFQRAVAERLGRRSGKQKKAVRYPFQLRMAGHYWTL